MDRHIHIQITEKYTQKKVILKSTPEVYQGLSIMLEELNNVNGHEPIYELYLDLENPILRMDLSNLIWCQPVTKDDVNMSIYKHSYVYNNLEQKAYQIVLDTFHDEHYIDNYGYIIPDNYDVTYVYKSSDSNVLLFVFIQREEFIEKYGRIFYDEFFSGLVAVTYFPFTRGTLQEFTPFNHGVLPFDPFEDSKDSQ